MSQQQVTTSSCQMENNDPMHDITSQETGVVLCYATDCLPHYYLTGCTLSWVHSVCNYLFPSCGQLPDDCTSCVFVAV